jgi:hypothetical protein
MTYYSLALFIHIVGVLGLFIGIGLQWISVQRLPQAQTVAQVREGTSLVAVQERLWPTASLLILLAGIYMTVTAWGWSTPWIDISLAALIVQGAVAGAVINRRLKAIHTGVAAAEAPAGSFPPGLKRQITDPILRTAVQINAFTGLGVVFQMTTKPGLGGSLITLAVALLLGIGAARIFWHPREEAMTRAGMTERS